MKTPDAKRIVSVLICFETKYSEAAVINPVGMIYLNWSKYWKSSRKRVLIKFFKRYKGAEKYSDYYSLLPSKK